MKKRIAVLLAAAGCAAHASVVLDHDFSASGTPPFAGGELNGKNGWVGQNGWVVNAAAGQVDCSLAGYLRIQNSTPAKGSNGFSIGNEIKLTGDHKVTLLADNNETDLGRAGILTTVAGNPKPTVGYKVEYSASENGKVKFVPDFNQASANSTKLIIEAIDLGLDPKGLFGPVDFQSDEFRIVWKASLSAVGEWVLGMSVTNLDSSASWEYAGDPLTMAFATDLNAFAAFHKANADVGQVYSVTRLKFEYFDLPENLETPVAPENFGVRPANARNIVEWDANSQTGFLEYRILRSLTSGGPFSQIAALTEPRFVDTDVTNGIPFYYQAVAVNIANQVSDLTPEQSGTPSASLTEPPNFLFIIADDMDTYAVNRYRETEPVELDASGNFYPIDTPNIDRLADEGMLFHQARLMGADLGAVCTPSRTTLMSGKNTWQRTVDVSAATTFPGIFNRGVRSGQGSLRHATYRTCKYGNSFPTANGEFDVVNDATKRGNTDGNGSEWHADHGVDYIADWAANHRTNYTPFLIYLGFSHPHDERLAREDPDLTGRYGCVNTTDPASIVLNTNAPPLPINHLSCTPATYPAHPFDHGHLDVRDEVSVAGMEMYRTETVVRNEIGRNFACVDWIDQQLGRVLDRLDDPNGDGDTSDSVRDNTYIVFTADHGMAIGRHGLQGKQNLYEHTWRVPYIVRGPGIEAGSVTDALIYLHDSFPTFCDLAGLDVPATIDENDGQSFKAVLEGASKTHRDVLYGLYAGGDKGGIRAVTDGRFKLIKYDVGERATQVTQLFDLEQNPFELLPEHGVPNLAEQPAYALIRQELEERLMEQRVFNADPYDMLGDRTLLRFESDLEDRFAFGNNAFAFSGTGGALPGFSSLTPDVQEYVVGEANTKSLSLFATNQQYLQINDPIGMSFGAAPFTIEAWVKLRRLPAAALPADAMPVVMKKAPGSEDAAMDYMFLASAGDYGDATTCSNLALHLGSDVVISDLAIPDEAWHFISVAFDPFADTVRFTLDELVDTKATSAAGTAGAGPVIVGAHLNSSNMVDRAFDGWIDELSIAAGYLAESELQPLASIPDPTPAILSTPIVSNSQFVVSFGSNPAHLYDVESKTDLTDPEWMIERTYLWDEGDSISLALDVPEDRTNRFFRVRTNKPQRP